MKTMYDSTNPLAIPLSAEMVAGYPGQFGWTPSIWGRWPRVREVHIDNHGGDPDGCDVLDIERGAADASQAKAWIEFRIKRGVRAALYFSRSNMEAVADELGSLRGVDVWVADWTGAAHTVTVASNMHLVAVQYKNTPSYDLSAVYDSHWPWRS